MGKNMSRKLLFAGLSKTEAKKRHSISKQQLSEDASSASSEQIQDSESVIEKADELYIKTDEYIPTITAGDHTTSSCVYEPTVKVENENPVVEQSDLRSVLSNAEPEPSIDNDFLQVAKRWSWSKGPSPNASPERDIARRSTVLLDFFALQYELDLEHSVSHASSEQSCDADCEEIYE